MHAAPIVKQFIAKADALFALTLRD